MQQLSLCLDLRRRSAGMLLLQVHDTVVAHLATTVQQAPLGVQDRRLLGPGVQPGDRQQHLNVRCRPGRCRRQHDPLTVQTPGQLPYQQLIDVRRQAAGPATIGRSCQAAIRLALQQGFALQVVGQGNRAQYHEHARALLRLARRATVKLIQGNRLVNAAAGQTEHAGEQQH